MSVQRSSVSPDRNTVVSELSASERDFISDRNNNNNNSINFTPHIPTPNPSPNHKYLLTDYTLLNKYYDDSNIRISSSDRDIITIGTLNVNGLNNPYTQECFIQSLLFINTDILGLSDTKLPSQNAAHLINTLPGYKSFWNPKQHSSQSGGVGLMFKAHVAKYVQKVSYWRDRIIIADLYFPGNNHVKVINTYIAPSSSSNKQSRKDTKTELIRLLHASDTNLCVLLGDFNTSVDDFLHRYDNSLPTKSLYPLFTYLKVHHYDDISPTWDRDGLRIPTYYQTNPSSQQRSRHSRPDGIWLSSQLIPEFISTNVQNINDLFTTDHQLLRVFLSTKDIFRCSKLAKRKQRNELDTCFHEKKMTSSSWDKFTILSDSQLRIQ